SITKKVYNTDVSTKPLAPDFSKSDVFVKSTEQDISQKGNLDGDLLVNGNTQHDKVYEANKNDSLTMTGLLNVSPIKKQLKELEDKYPSSGVATDIKVENVNTSFTAKMTLPEEMKFADGYTVELAGANGKFKITEQKVTGKTITVTLTVADNIKTFKEVKEAVYGVENDLKVNVKGVKFDTDKAKANTNYTIDGMVSGKFTAKATNILTGNVINFDYIWEGVQLAGGEDSTDPTTKDIKLTLKYVETAENTFEATQKLLGDILVGDNTEHDKVYEVEKGTKVAFTGSLDVSPVKKQMKDIEEQFKKTNTDPSIIKISDYSSTFTATLTLPEEMDFEGNPQVSLLNDNGKYRIVSSSVSGKTIKVVMTVNKEVKSFAELKDAVNGMEDKLNVVVNGARFNNKALENTNYTVKGTMTGELKAKARETATGNVINFKLNWYAEQLPEGADAINPTSKDITFTLKYVAKKPPVNPTNPTIPGNEKPNNKLPRTGAGTSIALYTVLIGISGALIVGLKRRKNEN
ncbi:MAG: LPXTG cell wall anchor domain-containing protein, partial [Parvimonas micra]|nr:LPXTG cell wall anchor domain-containing protein [Parvimonas micra]